MTSVATKERAITKMVLRKELACTACKEKGLDCEQGAGQTVCGECGNAERTCVFMDKSVDGKTSRATSTDYITTLNQRLEKIEVLLGKTSLAGRHGLKLAMPPPKLPNTAGATKTPVTDTEASNVYSRTSNPSAKPQKPNNATRRPTLERKKSDTNTKSPPKDTTASPTNSKKQTSGLVEQLLTTTGQLRFDSRTRKLRYFGPTTNFHIYSDSGLFLPQSLAPEADGEILNFIDTIPVTTQEYLLNVYWKYYNSVLRVIHKEAFLEDKRKNETRFYSGFLHLCILAMGFRFADGNRSDIQMISLPGRESTMYKKAKQVLEKEFEKTTGLPSIQAFLLLGDLECGCGRDGSGWMYAGMACRLAFDMGLNLDCTTLGLSSLEVQVRQLVLWACVIYDKYWALFLGRPTCMKSSDLSVGRLTALFNGLGRTVTSSSDEAEELSIYEALLDLMEIAGRVTESLDSIPAPTDQSAFLHMSSLDKQFRNWYARLPLALKWTPSNILKAKPSFFLLHQQYHVSLILLHRPFAFLKGADDSQAEFAHFSALSRKICFENAIQTTRIFMRSGEQYAYRRIFVTGLQHCGTASTALIACIASMENVEEKREPLRYLNTLSKMLEEMVPAYQPAERMSFVLKAVLRDSDWEVEPFPLKNIFSKCRRRSTSPAEEDPQPKRRHRSASARTTPALPVEVADVSATSPLFQLCDDDSKYDLFFENERSALGLKSQYIGSVLSPQPAMSTEGGEEQMSTFDIEGLKSLETGMSPGTWDDLFHMFMTAPETGG